jgi:hypothetical protein
MVEPTATEIAKSSWSFTDTFTAVMHSAPRGYKGYNGDMKVRACDRTDCGKQDQSDPFFPDRCGDTVHRLDKPVSGDRDGLS